MPNNLGRDDLIQMHQDLARRVTTLENSPQLGNVSIEAGALQILDGVGRLVMSLGYQPDGVIGLGLYDPVSGLRRIMLGLIDGEQALDFLDTSGNVVSKTDSIGFTLFDPSTATVQASIGQQSPGVFGLAVRNTVSGRLIVLSGTSTAVAPSAQTTSSTTAVTFSDDPSVTVEIGNSGQALVMFGSTIGVGGDGDQGNCYLTVDGTNMTATDRVSVSCGGAGIGVQSTVERTTTVTGLSLGPHTFSLQYLCLTGVHGVTFTTRHVSVTPF